MNSYKELLIDYLKKKDKLILDLTSIPLVFHEDLQEIENSWSEGTCESTLDAMSIFNGDAGICPWCCVYECWNCNYGRRHGICTMVGSNYRNIVNWLKNEYNIPNISKIPTMRSLVHDTNTLYEDLTEQED